MYPFGNGGSYGLGQKTPARNNIWFAKIAHTRVHSRTHTRTHTHPQIHTRTRNLTFLSYTQIHTYTHLLLKMLPYSETFPAQIFVLCHPQMKTCDRVRKPTFVHFRQTVLTNVLVVQLGARPLQVLEGSHSLVASPLRTNPG